MPALLLLSLLQPPLYFSNFEKGRINMNLFTHINTKNIFSATNMSGLSGKFEDQRNLSSNSPSMSISKLFPALLQCFGIILCGYIAGRVNIITSTQAKGLGNFVSRFALPALLFKNMVLLNFSNVNWSFLYSILIAKASVFFLVCALTLLIVTPEKRFSKAGLFPIFATQSNDFALGYPIGIASNYILKQKIPLYLENFLDSLANSFSGSALFYLGLTMVGQIKKLTRGTFVALILLITAKLLLMPLLCREMVELLDKSQSLVNHTSLSNYAFLYGVFPTAPDRLAAAIQNVSFDISIVSLVSLIWSLGVILLSKKYKQLPHMLTTNLLIAQCVACVGMVMWNFTIEKKSIFVQILVFIVLYCSLYSAFLWTGLLALSLLLLKRRENLKIPVGIITIAGWGIPVVIVGILLMAGKHTGEIDSAFFYGKHQQFQHQVEESEREVNQHYKPSSSVSHSETDSPTERENLIEFYTSQKQNGELCCSEEESASTTGLSENCSFSVETANQCLSPCSSQRCVLAQEEQLLQTGDQQLARHVLLCLLLIVGLFANLSSCLWWLFNQEPGRLYVELQFFCAVFNFGQGFISFGMFGLDKHLIILPFKRRLEFLWGARTVEQRESSVPEDIRMTCQQFVSYHRDMCVRSIVQDRRCGTKTVTGVFFGCDLVNWLLEVGLALDRGEAVVYGERLVKGGIIQHITNDFEFRDERLYYHFTATTTAIQDSRGNEDARGS
ncbi:Integral membrane protein, partial [Ophiophagus hannah]